MNAEHDRDRLLDQTLASSRGQGVPPPPGPACLDAETLAAWMDDGLDAGAVALAEAHASSCARCQALVGAMAHATHLAAPAAAPRRALWRWWLAPIAAAAAAGTIWMVMPPAPAPAPSQVPMVRTVPGVPAGLVPEVPPVPGVPPVRQAPEISAKRTTPTAPQSAEGPRMADTALRKGAARAPAALAESKLEAEVPAAASAAAERRDAAQLAAAPVAPDAPVAPVAPAAIREVPSPDPAIRWRIGTRGTVDYTSDGGSTWVPLAIGVTTELTAGASPSPTVCWLVGRGGVVLLATDGRTFARVPFPDAADLVGVQATDARSATVTAADGRRLATDDGGRSWSPR